MEPILIQEIEQRHIGDNQKYHGDGFTPRPLHHCLQFRLHHTHIGEFLVDGRKGILHTAVGLALDEGAAPFMEDPVGNLHLQAVDSAGDVGIDQFRFINEGFKVGFYRLIDIGQVFLDRPDQILGAQIRGGDDGDGGLQFLVEMFFVAGGSAAQIPDRYKGKTDTQNGHHVHIPNQKGKYSPHREQDQGQSFYCLIAVRPSGALQNLFQFVILIKKALGWCAQKNIQFIRQGGGFSLGAEEGVNKITRLHTKQSQKPSTEQDKTDKIDIRT